jgi:hypothetical protein
MHALLGPEDHAITIIPNYQSLESVPLSILPHDRHRTGCGSRVGIGFAAVSRRDSAEYEGGLHQFSAQSDGEVVSRAALDESFTVPRARNLPVQR